MVRSGIQGHGPRGNHRWEAIPWITSHVRHLGAVIPLTGLRIEDPRAGLFFGGPGLWQAALCQFRGLASCTPKNQPSGCCAPAEGQNVAELAEHDLGGEDLGEDKKHAE